MHCFTIQDNEITKHLWNVSQKSSALCYFDSSLWFEKFFYIHLKHMDFPLFVNSMYYLYCTIESCFFVYKKKCLYSLLRVIHEIKFLERQVLMSQLQFSSVAQSCPTLCELMDCSTPCLPVHNQLPEFTQTHVHRVGDAIQPSHVLSSPSPPAFNLSQHQGLFQ